MMQNETKEIPTGDEIDAAWKAFMQWAEKAKETRRQYVVGEISETTFAKWLALQ